MAIPAVDDPSSIRRGHDLSVGKYVVVKDSAPHRPFPAFDLGCTAANDPIAGGQGGQAFSRRFTGPGSSGGLPGGSSGGLPGGSSGGSPGGAPALSDAAGERPPFEASSPGGLGPPARRQVGGFLRSCTCSSGNGRTSPKECETFLGPKGFGAVQVSPPSEHAVLGGYPWWQRYQTVGYALDQSRSGTRPSSRIWCVAAPTPGSTSTSTPSSTT